MIDRPDHVEMIHTKRYTYTHTYIHTCRSVCWCTWCSLPRVTIPVSRVTGVAYSDGCHVCALIWHLPCCKNKQTNILFRCLNGFVHMSHTDILLRYLNGFIIRLYMLCTNLLIRYPNGFMICYKHYTQIFYLDIRMGLWYVIHITHKSSI
jgi:hypothetical protein